MKKAYLFVWLAAVSCARPSVAPAPLRPLTLESCVEILLTDPENPRAREIFPVLLQQADDRTMATMKESHNTGDAMMRHNYPSHLWIHPFLKGCHWLKEGDRKAADGEFEAARAAALGDTSRLATVVAQQARLHLDELRPRR